MHIKHRMQQLDRLFRLLNNISYKDKNDKVLHTFKNGLHVMQCRMEHGNIFYSN